MQNDVPLYDDQARVIMYVRVANEFYPVSATGAEQPKPSVHAVTLFKLKYRKNRPTVSSIHIAGARQHVMTK